MQTFEYGALLEGVYFALLRGSDLAIIGFFVISGFVVTESFSTYFKKFSPPGATGVFYCARLLRIWSLSIPSVLVTVALTWHYRTTTGDWTAWGRFDDFDPLGIVKSALGFSARWNPPMWTLAYEMFFYLLLPFTLLPFFSKSPALRASAILVGTAALVLIVRSVANLYLFVPFFVGMALYFLLPSIAKVLPSKATKIALLFIGAGSAILFTVTAGAADPFALAKVIAISIVILALLLGESFFRRNVRSFAILLGLSAASYSLYLWHWPVLWFSALYGFGYMNARTTQEIVTLYSIALPTLILVTFASWYLIERNARMKNVLRFFPASPQTAGPKSETV